MATDGEEKIEKQDQVPLLEADYLLEYGLSCTSQAARLVDETVGTLSLPQEGLEKIHHIIRAAIQENDNQHTTNGEIRLHILVTDSWMTTPPERQNIEKTIKGTHHTWGMFLVQHSESTPEGNTRQLIELRLYRENG